MSPIVNGIAKSALESIATSSGVLDLFKQQDKYIASDEFKDVMNKLDQFRESYSAKAGTLAGEFKTLLQNAMQQYFTSAQSVYEWCGVAGERLQSYLRLLQNLSLGKARMQHRILIQVLEDGITKMTRAQEQLELASLSFNKAAGSIVALTAQLNEDFTAQSQFVKTETERLHKEKHKAKSCIFWICWNNDKSRSIAELMKQVQEKLVEVKKFHEVIKTALGEADGKINETKKKLKDEIRAIGEVKSKAQVTLDTINDVEDIGELDDVLTNELRIPVEKLITECQNYRKRHIDEKEEFEKPAPQKEES